MTLAEAQARVAAATAAAAQQLELNKTMIGNQLDTADRVIMQRAAQATIDIAKLPESESPQ